jgi:hypothetical protein
MKRSHLLFAVTLLLTAVLNAAPIDPAVGKPAPAATGDDLEKAKAAAEKLGAKVRIDNPDSDIVYVAVDFRGSKITDDQLAVLKEFKGIRSLNVDLTDTGITDAGLKQLVKLSELSSLDLEGTQVTDAGVETLVNFFGELSFLSLGRTKITEKSYRQLFERFPRLQISRDKVATAGKYHVSEEFDAKGETMYRLWLADTVYAMTHKKPAAGSGLKDKSRDATTYYHVDGPVGQVLKHFRPAEGAITPATLISLGAGLGHAPWSPANGAWSEPAFGVLRLNAGTHAAYGRAFQVIDFYNGAPEVEELSLPAAGKPRYFSFIQDARDRGCNVRIFHGDERRTLRDKGPRGFYCALFMDVTRDDLRDINTALLTREAQTEFIESLAPHGVVCFHTSHRYHDLVPPLADAAKANGFAWKRAHDAGSERRIDDGHWASEWVMVARTAGDLEFLGNTKTITWDIPPATGEHVWTDKGKHDLEPLKRPPIK